METHAKTSDKRLIFKAKLIFILVAKATRIKIAEALEYQWFVNRLVMSFQTTSVFDIYIFKISLLKMKKIYIVRHAKSSWKDPGMKDFDRPLNKRGKHDAPLIGKLLRDRGIKPDWIVSSPANRAQTTAKTIAQEVGFPLNEIVLEQKIYEAYLEDVVDVIQCLPDEVETAFIFGHNPAFTYLVNHFNHGELVVNVPTCGIGCVETSAKHWSDIHPDNSNLVSFDYPKLHFYG